LRAEQQGGGQASAVRDAPGGDHRDRTGRVDHRRQQRQGPERAGVAARLSAWLMMTSTPALAARIACASVCTWLKISAPASWVGATKGVGSAKEWLIAATPSSSATWANSAVSGKAEMKPTPKGRSVSERAIRICSRSQEAPSRFVPPIMPKPPAFETAAASSPVAVPAMEALRIGRSMPSSAQSGVVIMNGLLGQFERLPR
jgi:hypothetical protein